MPQAIEPVNDAAPVLLDTEIEGMAVFGTTTPCANGHWFPGGGLPDGYPCQCGQITYSRRQAILDQIDRLKKELMDYE